MKAGELEGVRQLAPDVANAVLPRFIVPPKKERTEAEPFQPIGVTDLRLSTPRTSSMNMAAIA